MAKACVFQHHIADSELLALQGQQVQARHHNVAPENLGCNGLTLKTGRNGVQVFLLDQRYLPFAGFATFESVSLQALARGYRHAVERLNWLTACRADSNPFHATALREGV